ncbi:hypothetical protein BDZ91DRAFT_788240 [Kalaharituber pfeilii]|nr:hypothetical protein BDZ91DRAFT_788240 [Kalaharituber pfeilii]
MYHIRSASLATIPENLITNPELEIAYTKAQTNSTAHSSFELWHQILFEAFPKAADGQTGLSFTVMPLSDPSQAQPDEDLFISVSLDTLPASIKPAPILFAMGLHGPDKDTKLERELLVVRFVAWCKQKVPPNTGLRAVYGLLTMGTHARLVKYIKEEEVLRPYMKDQWLDAKEDGWRTRIYDIKNSIAEVMETM